MIQVRYGVFETNSSSTHSLTMMMKSDYERWEKEGLYLFDGYTDGWRSNKPVNGAVYTREEAVEFVKSNKYYRVGDEVDNEELSDWGFILFDDYGDDYLEGFYEEFTTPSGETIVAFGEYGYDS